MKNALPACLATLTLTASGAFAAAYVGSAYDGMAYTSGTQITGSTLNDGVGFNAAGDSSPNTGAWGAVLSSGAIRNIHTEGLSYSDSAYPAGTGLAVIVGGTGTAGANAGRNLGQSVDTGTFYFSYLTRKTVDTVRTLNFSLFSGTSERLAIGQIANNTNLRNPDGTADTLTTANSGQFAALISNSQNSTGLPLTLNGVYTSSAPVSYALDTTFLMVGKIEFGFNGGVEDRLSLYLNPTSLTDDSGLTPYLQVGVNDFGSISAFRVFAGGNQSSPNVFNASAGVFDEFRFGTSFADVTGAIPEPASFASLAGVCGLLLAGSRRRRS